MQLQFKDLQDLRSRRQDKTFSRLVTRQAFANNPAAVWFASRFAHCQMASKPAADGPAAEGPKGSKQTDLSSFFGKAANAKPKRTSNTMEDATNLPSKQVEVGICFLCSA
jgi:hypothetical protein